MDTPILTGFQAALLREGLAKSTREKYVQHVTEFIDALGGEERVLTATRSDAEDYLDRLLIHHELAIPTVRLRISALKRFYGYLEERDMLADRNPFAHIKAPKQRRKPNDWLRPDEDEAVYSKCMTRQERVLHGLLRYAGLRIGEATALTQRNVDLERGEIRVTVSKSDAGLRTVPIHPRLRKELESWFSDLDRRGLSRADLPLLVTSNETAMKSQFADRLVKRIAARAGVRTVASRKLSAVSCHTLRRTFGTDLLNKGTRIETVSKLLGHADTRVTLDCYAELLDETVRAEAMNAWAS